MRASNNQDKRTIPGFRDHSRAAAAMTATSGRTLERVIAAEGLPEASRLPTITYDDSDGKYYQVFKVNGSKVRTAVKRDDVVTLGKKVLEEYLTLTSQTSTYDPQNNISATYDFGENSDKKNPDASYNGFSLGRIAAALAVVAGLSAAASGCAEHKKHERGLSPDQISAQRDATAEQKAKERLGIQEDGSTTLRAYDGSVEPVPYNGSRTDPKDPNARIDLEGEWNRMLFTGKDMPTDPAKIMVKKDTNGNYVSASYVGADGNDKQVNPFAVQLANLFVGNGIQADANGNGIGPALQFEKYVIQFNKWTDGDITNYELVPKQNRYMDDDGSTAQSLEGMFRFTFTKDPNYDPKKSLTYNVKLVGGMGGSFATATAAREYFVKNVLFPLLTGENRVNLDKGIPNKQLNGVPGRVEDPETPRPLN
ncbi:hypothetical protein J4206_00595 [Candidatus Woesearchaeota archaeon]|nr:hypothetical protein [Candidatus Woesearchaeota archaeon]